MKGKRDNYKWLTGYKVVKVIYPDSEHWIGKAVQVVDEGAFGVISGKQVPCDMTRKNMTSLCFDAKSHVDRSIEEPAVF